MKQIIATTLTVVVTLAMVSLFGGGVIQPQRAEIPHIVNLQIGSIEQNGNTSSHILYRCWSDGVIDHMVVRGTRPSEGSSVDLSTWGFYDPNYASPAFTTGWKILPTE